MKYVFADTACTISVPLEPQADSGSVKWTLRNNFGAQVSQGVVQNLMGAFNAEVVVAASFNAKQAFTESRFVTFNWTANGHSHSTTVTYVLMDFLPLRTQPEDVRSAIGLNSAELPDTDIDLPEAAFNVRNDIGPVKFDALLTEGSLNTMHLSNMVALWCAASFATSLPLRTVQSMGNEQAKFSRFSKLNLPSIVDALRGEYERLKGMVTGTDTTSSGPTPLIFTTSLPGVDAIKGPGTWSNFPKWFLPFQR